jgi:hypothetical protein
LLADAITSSNRNQDVMTDARARARVVQDQLTGAPTGVQPPTPISRG